MPYNKLNKLERDLKIIDIVQKYYEEGVTTYKGIFEKYVYPIYPMNYTTFMIIMRSPNPRKQIEDEKRRIALAGRKR